jgi:glucose/arabinose dehydrogenase
VNYTDTHGDTRVVEYRSSNGVAQASTARQILFVAQPYPNHNGGQLEFDGKGYLYVGMGDGGSGGDPGNRAQNLKSRLGKLLRINPLRAGSTWQIVGFGLRNPWRFSFDRKTGNLWIGDVGQGNWEEVDYRNAARVGLLANYGWSRYEGKSVYDPAKPLVHKGDLISPVALYSHAGGACSITGGYVYRGSAVPSAQGRYFYGDFCSGTIWSFKAGNGRLSAPRVEGKIDQLSSFGEDGNGELYATSLSGTVSRVP